MLHASTKLVRLGGIADVRAIGRIVQYGLKAAIRCEMHQGRLRAETGPCTDAH